MDGLKLFQKGYAIGKPDIRGDCYHFRYENEFFVVYDRSLKVRKIGGKLVAKVADVRRTSNG